LGAWSDREMERRKSVVRERILRRRQLEKEKQKQEKQKRKRARVEPSTHEVVLLSSDDE